VRRAAVGDITISVTSADFGAAAALRNNTAALR
jgi:hypothetical protein